ncbi:MAG: trypsin-like peptidase domain-containing protein [Oceanibaculum sp.]
MAGTPVSVTDLYPWRTIVYVRATFDTGDGGTQTYFGSGFMAGRNDVITASHLVYSGLYGEAIRVEVFPGKNGAYEPYGSYLAESWNYNEIDKDGGGTITDTEVRDDIALLSFSVPIGDVTGWMGLESNFLSGSLNVTGYPTRSDLGVARMVTDTAASQLDSVNDTVFVGYHDIRPGSSGSPVWYLHEGIPYAAAVVSTATWAANIGGPYYDALLYLMAANETLLAEYGGIDVTSGALDDALSGTRFGDRIDGGAGNDTLEGLLGSDTLIGGTGDDVLRGGKGFDSLVGGAGNDTLYAGLGQDTLTGGTGADLFVLRGYDPRFPGAVLKPTITDFVRGTDLIGLEGIDRAAVEAALLIQDSIEGGMVFGVGGATVTVLGVAALGIEDFVFAGF